MILIPFSKINFLTSKENSSVLEVKYLSRGKFLKGTQFDEFVELSLGDLGQFIKGMSGLYKIVKAFCPDIFFKLKNIISIIFLIIKSYIVNRDNKC